MDQKIQVEVSGDSSGLLASLSKGLEGLKGFSEGVKSHMDKAAEGSSRFKGEIGQLEGKVKSLREELLRLKQAELAGGGDKALAAQIRATGGALSAAEKDLLTFRKGAGPVTEEVNHLENAMLGLKGSAPELGEQLEGVTGKFGLMKLGAAAAAGAIVAALIGMVKSFAENADAAGKTSQKVGLTVEEFTRLKHAGDMADVTLESLTTGLGKLAKNLDEAALTGHGPAAQTLDDLGISAVTADGHLRPLHDVLADVAEQFASMPDGPEKTAAAMNLFGKSGKDLIPLLNEGKTGLEEMEKEADRLGVTLSEADAAAAEKFNDDLKRLESGFEGLKNKIAREFMPAANDFADWASKQGPGAMDVLIAVLKTMITQWRFFVMVVQDVGAIAGDIIEQMITHVKGLSTVLYRIFTGDFKGAMEASNQFLEETKGNFKAAGASIVQNWKNMAEGVKTTWQGEAPGKPKKPRGPDDEIVGNPDPNKPPPGFFANTTFWTAKEQEAMDKLAAMRQKNLDALFQIQEKYDAGQDALHLKQLDSDAKVEEERLRNGEISQAEYLRRLEVFENAKYAITMAGLQRQAILEDANLEKQQEIYNKMTLLAEEHQERVLALQRQQGAEQRKEAQQTSQVIAQTVVGIISRARSWTDVIKGFQQAFTQFLVKIVGQWIQKQIEMMIIGNAAAKGAQTNANTKTVAATQEAGANTVAASSEFFKAHAWIPFVGAAIAIGMILLMMSQMDKVKSTATARKTGGLAGLSGPELTLLGDGGEPELVAPESNFMDWAAASGRMSFNLGANLAYRQAQISALDSTAAGYANAPARVSAGGETGDGGHHFYEGAFRGVFEGAQFFDTSRGGMRAAADYLQEAMQLGTRARNGRITPGQGFQSGR